MKHLKIFEEVLRTRGMTREEESELYFKEAADKGSSGPNVDYLSDDWKKVASKYHIYDDYYLYNGCILEFYEIESGNWYSQHLTRLDTTPEIFKLNIQKKINKLQNALKLIENK